MRDLLSKFFKTNSGASLVEYAVALIVVTIVGGAGVIAISQNSGEITEAACDSAKKAVDMLAQEDVQNIDAVGCG